MSSTHTSQAPSSVADVMPSSTGSQVASSSVSTSSAITSQTQLNFVSRSTPTQYHVFLSFRGKDTRFNFTSHLYQRLDDHGIRTFMDDPELRGGEVISDALIQAIHESMTYIVVFSENYATSSWCLNELVEILNCHKTDDRLIIPVFYKIDPSVVRHQRGSFKEAFRKHQVRVEMEKVNNWRSTLTQVADLSGLHISEYTSEADIINQIVDEILPKIDSKLLDVAKYPVGMDSRVKHLISKLGADSEGVIKIGIYGMGGIGKTTLAKALFNQLLLGGRFKHSCFLPNIRDALGRYKGMESLQQTLINEVLESNKRIEVHSVEEGAKLIRERTCSAKVLVLVDDIDHSNQFESLIGPFASGSVVIVTTRNEDMLYKIKVEPRYQYKLEVLNDKESLSLFTKHAFGDDEQDNHLMVLSRDILRLADGLPLALVVFGGYLSTERSEVGWRSYIEKLQRNPDSTIQQKLEISLNAIEVEDRLLKEIFLDIACFFIGWNIEEVSKVMGTYYHYVDHQIGILKKRCLVRIYSISRDSQEQVLDMHDLLRDMGREVVRSISPKEPGRRSRLWILEDVNDVLKMHKGTETIEVIITPVHSSGYQLERKSFSIETFKWMSKLRFLYLEDVNLTGNFEQTFEDLRWFYWNRCPLNCLPSEFHPQKLEILELRDSNMRTLWELNMASQDFGRLKSLNMSCSKNLSTITDFTRVPCLETLDLQFCESLEEVHMSIGSLVSLVSLDLHGCVKLTSLPDTICDLGVLEVLNLYGCTSLRVLPTELGNIKSLTNLIAGETCLTELPESIGNLTKLVVLHLRLNKELETLPDTIGNLRSLEILNINECEKLEILPDQLWKMTRLRELSARDTTKLKKLPDIGSSQIALSLQKLDLFSSGIKALPSCVSQLSNLKEINAWGCFSLERLPNLSNLKHLETLNLHACTSLTEIQGLEGLTTLRELHLEGCMGLSYIQGFEKLVTLELRHSEMRTMLVSHVFEKLTTLNMDSSLYLTTSPDFTKLPCLTMLSLIGCESLEEVHKTIGSLMSLVCLVLKGCVKLRSLPDTICNLRALKLLDLGDCSCLEGLPLALGNIESLSFLDVMNTNVSKLPDSVGCLSKLVGLRLSGNKNLKTLPDTICNLRALEVLGISDCSCLEALPTGLGNIQSLQELEAENLAVSKLPDSVGRLSKLVELRLSGNKNLETLPDTICNLGSLEILDISGCEKLEILPNQLCMVTSLRELIAGGATLLKRFPYVESCQITLSLQKLDFSEWGLTALPSSISQLPNLEDLNLKNCRRLLSITELPGNLKQIRADGCRSMERLPNLSNLKQLEYLNLEDCSGLIEIQGLEGLCSIRTLHLEGCNSYILASIFTKNFFQVYSGFGNPIQIYAPFPELSFLSESTISGMYNLPSNVSHHSSGMILCFNFSNLSKWFSIASLPSGHMWCGSFDAYTKKSIMVIVPRSIFSVRDGDVLIRSTSNEAIIHGIHYLL